MGPFNFVQNFVASSTNGINYTLKERLTSVSFPSIPGIQSSIGDGKLWQTALLSTLKVETCAFIKDLIHSVSNHYASVGIIAFAFNDSGCI